MQRTLLTILIQTVIVATSIYSFRGDDNPCVFKVGDGGVINLTSVVDPTASLRVTVNGTTTTRIDYNPCHNFTEQGVGQKNCKDVTVCVINNDTEYSNFGNYNSIQKGLESKPYHLNYSYKENKTYVELSCQQELKEAKLTFTNITNNGTSLFLKLETECACPNKCYVKPKNKDDGLSTGSILIIIFFVGIFVYLFGGVLFLHVVQGVSGIESIPHYEFWKDLPMLIRDGVVFSMSGCKTPVVYDRI